VTKIFFLALNASHATLVVNDKGYWMKEKIKKYITSSFDYIIYILSNAIKMQIFWSLVNANDEMPHVAIFNYLIYINYYYLKIMWDIQFKCLNDFILWHVAQCKYAMWLIKKWYKILILGW
jgi:hypothetical protein